MLVACVALGYGIQMYFPKDHQPHQPVGVPSSALADSEGEQERMEKEAYEAELERLRSLMPTSGFDRLGMQRKHPLGGMTTTREEKAGYPFNLGPTGILARRDPKEQEYTVTEVLGGSPAEGKVQVGDVISGVFGQRFSEIEGPEVAKARFPNPQMGMAIERAESVEDGQLNLMVERNGGEIEISLQLERLGAFGDGFPMRSAKADFLAEMHAQILAAQQNSDGSWGSGFSDDKKQVGKLLPTCMGGLALLSTGEEKYREAIDRCYEWVLGQYPKSFQSWFFCYRAAFLAEYAFRYGDERAKDEIKRMVDELAGGAFYYNGVYGYGHSLIRGNYRYGGINACTAHVALTFGIAKAMGVEVPEGMDMAMARSIERLAPDGALDYGWTARSKGKITSVKHNEDQGRTGVAYMAYRLLGGKEDHLNKMLDYLLLNKEYTDCGHSSGGSMSWVWASIGIGFESEEAYRELMQSRIWYWNFNRRHDAGFYLQPSAHLQFRPSDIVLGAHYTNAGNVILLNRHKGNMLLTGKEAYKTPSKELYTESLVASSDYFERQDRVVEVAEAVSLIGERSPSSVIALMEALKRVAIESPDYQKEVVAVYEAHLDKAVRDVANMSLTSETRNKVLAALLGVNYNCQMSIRGKNARVTHRVTGPNLGEIELVATVEGAKGKLEKKLSAGETRESQRFGQTVKVKEGDTDVQLAGKTVILWKDIQVEYDYMLEHSEGVRGKWSRNPSDTVYGPFVARVEKAMENGAFQARMAGDVLFECSLMGNTELINAEGDVTTYAEWKKKRKKNLEAGTLVRFGYFNRGGNPFLPMTDRIEILE
ncbi:DUF6288 domain-containing protein [Rubritalea tangerina]